MTDFNFLLSCANNAFARLTPQEREWHKRNRAVNYVYAGLLRDGTWHGQYKDIEDAYDNRFLELH